MEIELDPHPEPRKNTAPNFQDSPYSPPKSDLVQPSPNNESGHDQSMTEKSRHGCLTAWLVIMLLANTATFFIYLVSGKNIFLRYPDAPSWAMPALIIGALLNIIFTIALFRWKLWGFIGCMITYALGTFVNLQIGLSVLQVMFGLVGLAILYGVLQLGSENKGWPQLE